MKQKIAVLTKEFQGKESALVLARNSVLVSVHLSIFLSMLIVLQKENQELKKRLAEAESVPNSLATSRNGDCSFHVAELEQKLRKEMSLTRKYEQRLQQLESQLKNNSASDSKMEVSTFFFFRKKFRNFSLFSLPTSN